MPLLLFPPKKWTFHHNSHACTHISVFVVTVGSQENLGNFIHSAEEKRQLPLVGTEKNQRKEKTEALRIFTNHIDFVCVLLHRTHTHTHTLAAPLMNTNYLHLSLHTSPGSQPSSPSEYPAFVRDGSQTKQNQNTQCNCRRITSLCHQETSHTQHMMTCGLKLWVVQDVSAERAVPITDLVAKQDCFSFNFM